MDWKKEWENINKMLILITENSELSSYFWILSNEYASLKPIGSRLIKTRAN